MTTSSSLAGELGPAQELADSGAHPLVRAAAKLVEATCSPLSGEQHEVGLASQAFLSDSRDGVAQWRQCRHHAPLPKSPCSAHAVATCVHQLWSCCTCRPLHQARGPPAAAHPCVPQAATGCAAAQVKLLLDSVPGFDCTVFKLPMRAAAGAHCTALAPLIQAAYALRQELSLSHAAVGLNIEIEVRPCATSPHNPALAGLAGPPLPCRWPGWRAEGCNARSALLRRRCAHSLTCCEASRSSRPTASSA